MSDMPTGRYGLGCGAVPSQTGPGVEVVAVGGYSKNGTRDRGTATVEIYSVGTDTWRRGKRIQCLSNNMTISQYDPLWNS